MTASSPPALPGERLVSGAARPARRDRGRFSPEAIQRLVTDSRERPIEHARVRTHLVVLAEQPATKQPDALARVQGAPGSGLPHGLSVCGLPHARTASRGETAVAGRSRMAAALAHRAGGRAVLSSAGTRPAAGAEPVLARVPAEAGTDLAGAFPEPPTDEVVRAADIVRTMGCGAARPVVPGRRYLDRPVTAPEGDPLTVVVRGLRDGTDARVTEPLDSLPSA
ncbi:arsenate reductase ArsC [Streptomyces sp. NPDC014995]|uniref:arsenate reductase ArsC n=1 Tax=Streptomyces sp. NPDC014995 TaxID=3364936 RepID=UPI0036FB5F66